MEPLAVRARRAERTDEMLQALRDRRQDDRGFTLIELMIVILIIGILISVGLPTFLGARERAQDRAAQAQLRNGAAAAKTFYTDENSYTGFDDAAATAIEPSIAWGGSAVNDVRISGASGNVICLEATSGTDTVWSWVDSNVAGAVLGIQEGAC